MPIHYEYESETNTLILRVYGTVNSKEIIDYFAEILERNILKKGFTEIVNLNEVEDFIMHYSDLKELKRLTIELNKIGQKATVICSYNTISQEISSMMRPFYNATTFNFFICVNEEEHQMYLDTLK